MDESVGIPDWKSSLLPFHKFYSHAYDLLKNL